jgi:hypothetical protein
MQDLKVIGVEGTALLVASDEGERYRIEIDDTVRSRVRQTASDQSNARKLAPKEIQAHIRSGMSAQDVAAITGAPLEYIERFEGPVLAEREFVVESALAVQVRTAADTDPLESGPTFGNVIMSRLHGLGATGERWASWKDEATGWVVKLSFTADQVDHDARWKFDPKKSALAPLNNEAVTLSQQGELAGGLIPRLRAVDSDTQTIDTSRFDSGAFVEQDLTAGDSSSRDTAPHLEAVVYGRVGATTPAEEAREQDAAPSHQTADLLEALRRRRGEREAAQYDELEEAKSDHPSTGSIRLVEVPLPELEDDSPQSTAPQPIAGHANQSRTSKKGRATMPSWDEIVFGARSDDDPA